MSKDLIKLINDQNWSVKKIDGVLKVNAYGEEFDLTHPFAIYGKLYRKEKNPDVKYTFIKKMHDFLWPKDIAVWNYWTEDRFRTYCSGYRIMVWASGASMGKSVDAAKLALLEWVCDPKNTGAIVVSTTIESLDARVYGYLIRYLKKMALPLQYVVVRSKPKKVLYDKDDTINCISALAAAKGTDDDAIKNYIGRHPNRKLILVLDESPDLNPVILNALANLEAGDKDFQVLSLGNSSSKHDLHGSLATPKGGWDSIDPNVHTRWETTQKNGICLYFNPHNSPAIFETDPEKKKLLNFLPTLQTIEEAKEKYGESSVEFWRMIMGFWKSDAIDNTVISKQFIDDYRVFEQAEWLGLHPLQVVAGLDPAFSTGGDQCILRLAILGQTTDGQIVLDYRKESLLFKIPILIGTKSPELQISDKVIEVLSQYNCPLHCVCVDSNGQGRALGEVISLRMKSLKPPIKIYSVKVGAATTKSFDVVIKTPYEMWFGFRDFIQRGQIKGLDFESIRQLTSRLIKIEGRKQTLESKIEYKARMNAISPKLGRSPDEADAAALCLQSAIINFGFAPGQKREAYGDSFRHDKRWVLSQLSKGSSSETPTKVVPQAPLATFTGDIADIKLPFS